MVTRRACLISLGGLGGLALVPRAAQARRTTSAAVPAEVAAELPGARLQGSGRLTFFGLQVYDARLWVREGFDAARFEQQPFALELEYARTLYGRLIAERSLEEMKRLGNVDDALQQRWLDEMKRMFPDVAKGDRITGVHQPLEAARFFVNGRLRGEVRDAEFARRFFAIWLGPQTSEPGLRLALLGGSGTRS